MAQFACHYLDSPVGRLLAVASETGLCGLPFLGERRVAAAPDRDGDVGADADGRPSPESDGRIWLETRLRRWCGEAVLVERPDHPVLRETRAWLDAYFAGLLADRPLPPLDMHGGTFERGVWCQLLTIPIGKTVSYGDIARQLGRGGAARAVGLANGANPVPIIVPCHRVIGASGALTGYGGGLPRKTWLLDHERRHWGRALTLPFK